MKASPKWTIHVIAQCCDCDAVFEDYRTAVRKARSHAGQTGHKVAVERAQSWYYNKRPKGQSDDI